MAVHTFFEVDKQKLIVKWYSIAWILNQWQSKHLSITSHSSFICCNYRHWGHKTTSLVTFTKAASVVVKNFQIIDNAPLVASVHQHCTRMTLPICQRECSGHKCPLAVSRICTDANVAFSRFARPLSSLTFTPTCTVRIKLTAAS